MEAAASILVASPEASLQKSRPTQHKRARERARLEKQQQKAARRQEQKKGRRTNRRAVATRIPISRASCRVHNRRPGRTIESRRQLHAFISSIPAMYRSASRSSHRGGCTFWRPQPGRAGAIHTSSTNRSRKPTSRRSLPATSSASASTRETRSGATKSVNACASSAPGSSSVAFTPRSIRTRRTSTATRTPSSRATATSSGSRWSKTVSPAGRRRMYDGGRVAGERFLSARWDLLPEGRYMWASVQTVRGCPKHCSFCSVWRTDGQEPRQREADPVVREIVELRRRGFRFIALADDNFYPVTFEDLAAARRRSDPSRLQRTGGAARRSASRS